MPTKVHNSNNNDNNFNNIFLTCWAHVWIPSTVLLSLQPPDFANDLPVAANLDAWLEKFLAFSSKFSSLLGVPVIHNQLSTIDKPFCIKTAITVLRQHEQQLFSKIHSCNRSHHCSNRTDCFSKSSTGPVNSERAVAHI